MDNHEEGAFIISRSLFDSDIWFLSPPEDLKVFIYLVGKAAYRRRKYKGYTLERGQYFCDSKELLEQLKYSIGYRKKVPNESFMKNLMKRLRKLHVIATTKEPRGMVVTICNYDHYQDLKMYEKTNEKTNEETTKKPRRNQECPSINKKEKNLRNKERNKPPISPDGGESEDFENDRGCDCAGSMDVLTYVHAGFSTRMGDSENGRDGNEKSHQGRRHSNYGDSCDTSLDDAQIPNALDLADSKIKTDSKSHFQEVKTVAAGATHQRPENGRKKQINSNAPKAENNAKKEAMLKRENDFQDKFWSKYPKRPRGNRKTALKKFKGMSQKKIEPFLRAFENYLTVCKETENQYIKMANTFLADGCWQEYVNKEDCNAKHEGHDKDHNRRVEENRTKGGKYKPKSGLSDALRNM